VPKKILARCEFFTKAYTPIGDVTNPRLRNQAGSFDFLQKKIAPVGGDLGVHFLHGPMTYW